MYSILTGRKAVKVISAVTSVGSAYAQPYVTTQEDLYHYTYKVVSERFQYFLQDVERTVGDKQHGIMVADHRGKAEDDGLRSRHHRLIDQQAPVFSNYQNYIETLFLTPSHHSVGIQFADMIAGAIGRKFNSNDTAFYDMIAPSFRKSPQNKIDGWGLCKFPTQGWV